MYGQETRQRRSFDEIMGEVDAEFSAPVKPKLRPKAPRPSFDQIAGDVEAEFSTPTFDQISEKLAVTSGTDPAKWAIPGTKTAKPAMRTGPDRDSQGVETGAGIVTTKPEGVAPKLRPIDPRARQAAKVAREIEGLKKQSVDLFQQADQMPAEYPVGFAQPRELLRAQAEGKLASANELARRAQKQFGDHLEVGFGKDADPNSKREWAYAKTKTSKGREESDVLAIEAGNRRRFADPQGELNQALNVAPEAKARFERQRRIESLRGTPSLDPVSRMGARVAGLVRGATPDEMDEAIPPIGPEVDVNRVLQSGAKGVGQLVRGGATALPYVMPGVDALSKVTTGRPLRNWTEKVGRAEEGIINRTAETVLPEDPTDQSFLANLERGAGSLIPSVGGALLTGGGSVAHGALGALTKLGQVTNERDASGVPISDARRISSDAFAAATGMTEALGMGKLLDRIGLKTALIKRVGQALEEGGQEYAQGYLDDINAKLVAAYDPQRQLDDPLSAKRLEEAAIGAILGSAGEVADVAAGAVQQNAQRRLLEQTRRIIDLRSKANADALAQPSAGSSVRPTMLGPTQITPAPNSKEIPAEIPDGANVLPVESTPASAPPQASSAAISAPAQPSVLFPEALPIEAPLPDLSTLSPQDRVTAMLTRLKQQQEKKQATTLEQALNKDFAESSVLISNATQNWDADRPTAELMAVRGTQRLSAALLKLQKSPAYQKELNAVATGAGQPGPYIAAAQSIQQQLDQAESLFSLDAERERQQAELAKQQKKAEKEQAKQVRFAEKEQQKLDRKLLVEQKRAETQAKRDEATAKRMQASEMSKQKRRAELEKIRQQARDEKGRQIAQKELDRLALHDAALKAADAAGQRHQEFISQGQIAEAVNELTVQQKQIGDAVRHLPRTPEAQNIKADLSRYQGQIGNRIGDLRKQMSGKSVPVTQAIPPLLRSDAVVNPAGGVPPMQSFYEPGAVFDRLNPSLGDVEEDSTPLLTAIRRAGGIANDAISPGELRRLGVKESGTTGLVNDKGGLAPDRMREAMVEAGYLADDSTVDDLFQAIEGEVRAGQRRARPKDSIADFYEDWEASQGDRETEGQGDGETDGKKTASYAEEKPQSRQRPPIEEFASDIEADDLAALDRAIRRSERENPRPYNERTRPGEPGSGLVSFSQYAELEARNPEQEQALYNNEPGSETFNDAIDWITEDAAKAGISQNHVDAMVAYALNWHGEQARMTEQGIDPETVSAQQFGQQVNELTEQKQQVDVRILRESDPLPDEDVDWVDLQVRAIDELFSIAQADPAMMAALEAAVGGGQKETGDFADAAERIHGFDRDIARQFVENRRANRTGQTTVPNQNAQAEYRSQEDSASSDSRKESSARVQRPPKPTEQELRLLRIQPREVSDRDYDRYMVAVEDLYARAVRGEVDIDPMSIYEPAKWVGKSEAEVDAMRKAGINAGILAKIHGHRSDRVDENRLPSRENVELINRYKNADLDTLAKPKREGRKSRVEQLVEATNTILGDNPSGVSPQWMEEVRDLNERAKTVFTPYLVSRYKDADLSARSLAKRGPKRKSGKERQSQLEQIIELTDAVLNKKSSAAAPEWIKEVRDLNERAKAAQAEPNASHKVKHPNPAIDGKPILAKTDDGRVIVENANNKSGVSVVKDYSSNKTTETGIISQDVSGNRANSNDLETGSDSGRLGERSLSGSERGSGADQRASAETGVSGLPAGSRRGDVEAGSRADVGANRANRPASGSGTADPSAKLTESGRGAQSDRLPQSEASRASEQAGSVSGERTGQSGQSGSAEPGSTGQSGTVAGRTDENIAGFRIGDTFVSDEALASLPKFQQNEIQRLRQEYAKLGVVRPETETESDQFARLSLKERRKAGRAMIDAKNIEDRVRTLLKMEGQQEPASADRFYAGDSVTWQRGDKTESGKIIKIASGYATIEKANGDKPTVHVSKLTAAEVQPKTREQKTDAPSAARTLTDARIQFKSGKRGQAGTLYANEPALDVMRAAYEESHGEKRYFANVNMNSAAARKIASALTNAANDPDFDAVTQRKLRTVAREFSAAAQSGETVSIVSTAEGRKFSDIKVSRRHELFHDAQEGLQNSPGFLAKHKYGQPLIDRLAEMGYVPEDRTTEAAAFIAGGQAKDFGLTEAQGNEFLEDYFDDIVKNNGAAALKRFFSVAPHAVKTLKQARQKYGIELQGQTGKDYSRASGERGAGRSGTQDRTSREGGRVLQASRSGQIREQRGIRFSFGELENEPTGVVLGSGLGGFQGVRRGPQPKSSPYREIFAEHKPLVADPYKLQDHTIEELLSAGAKGTLPGARALHWASKLKLKPVADKLADRQADFITKTIEQTNEMIAASEAMGTAEPGGASYKKAKQKFDNARLKIADALAKAGEYTTIPGYAAKTYKSSLLSAPHIHLFNLLEQAFKMPLHSAQRAADAIVPASVLNKFGIPYTKGITDFRDLVPAIEAEFRGLGAGLKEIPRDVLDMFRYGVTRQMQQADDAEAGNAGGTDKFELGHRAKMIPGLDQVLNFIGRSHGAADVAFTNLVNATAISAQANAIARKVGKENGLSKKEMNDLARDLAYRPSALMVTLANDAALRFKLDYPTLAYDALQKLRDLPGSVMGKASEKGVGKFADATWKAAMDFVVPFSKIPLAAVDTYLFRYSPVALGRVAGRMAMAKGGEYAGRYKGEFAKQRFGEDTAELLRQGLVGSLSWALLGALGSFGYLSFTGGGEDDKDRPNVKNVREALRVSYGPEVRVGDYALNLNRMGPLGQAAGIATRIHEAQKPRTDPKTGEPEETGKRIARTANAAKDALVFNNPLGQAAKDIAGDDAHSTSAGQYVAGKLRGFVPGLARDIAKIQSPTKRVAEESSTLGRLKGDLQSGMPIDIGFGSREQMTERLDALGRPIEEQNPFTFWRKVPRDPQLEEMERLGVGFSKPKRDKGETAAEYNRRVTGFTDSTTGEHVPGSADNLQKALRRIAEDPNWKKRSDEAKARIYSTELQPKAIERADKLSEESVETEREIEALRADAYDALRKLPSYQQMKDSQKDAARDQIDAQLKVFRARAESTRKSKSGRVSIVKEKVAQLPDYDPTALARMAVLNAQP